MKQFFKAATVMWLLLFFLNAHAQTSSAVLTDRLCQTWIMKKQQTGDQVGKENPSGISFEMIISPDRTVKQGMPPDGMIDGTWQLDEKQMIISISDKVTAQHYSMKIISLTQHQLILMEVNSNPPFTIYYSSE